MSERISGCTDRNRSFAAIDLVKFVCSLFVVAIHVAPFGNAGSAFQQTANFVLAKYLSRIAVPFFLMSTGFLVFRKAGQGEDAAAYGIRHAKRIWRLYVLWSLIYLPFAARIVLRDYGGGLMSIAAYARNFVFDGSYAHLWYLNASAFAVCLVSILLKRNWKISAILSVSAALYLIGLLPQSYFGLMRKLEAFPAVWNALRLTSHIVPTTRSGLFEAFFFVSLGAAFAVKPVRFPAAVSFGGFLISMALLYVEIRILSKIGWVREFDMYLFLLPAAFFLFSIAVHADLAPRKGYTVLRMLSSRIFFIHMLANSFVRIVFHFAGIDAIRTSLQFVSTLTVSFAGACILVLIRNTRVGGWLNRLF